MEVQSSASEDHTHSAPADHALIKAKGDVLDRFWASVEPYCADITETELNMLEEGMKSVREIEILRQKISWKKLFRYKINGNFSSWHYNFYPLFSMTVEMTHTLSPLWVCTTPRDGP